MKPARVPQTVVAPDCWGDLPWGELYRKALERQLNPWFTKMYGFHLLKIGNLSAEINCEACAVSHQVNVSAQGMPVQVQADPLHLPFADKSVDVCLLAHTLPWCTDPHRLLREADRVLIDDGWLVISGFNPISLMGLRKLVPVLRKNSPYNSRMFTLMRQLDWLSLLNFEVLHASRFHVLPWNKHGGKLLNAHIPALGCLQLIVARKRTIPLTLNPMKQSKNKPRIRQAVGFNPFPFDLMLPQCSIKTLPEIDIFYWFFVCGFPATFFPVMDPLGDTLADILAVGTQNDFAMFF